MYTTLRTNSGITMITHPLGASWVSCQIPHPSGDNREILLGHSDMQQSLRCNVYLGNTVGRYAGRIAYGRYGNHQLSINQPPHHLHGGAQGLARQIWQIDSHSTQHITYRIDSPHGAEGYPGNLTIYTTYRIIDAHTMRIEWRATTDSETIINLTNHAYFNLNGDNHQQANGLAQYLHIAADSFVPVDTTGIPIADSALVSADMDFRQSKCIAKDFLQSPTQQAVGGYDHSYLVDTQSTRPQATLESHNHDLQLSIQTTQPAIHIYTGQYLAGTPNRQQGQYANLAGVAIETQAPPDSPNRRPQLVTLTPDTPYQHHSDYHFTW